jgi:hypothetical protein
MTIHTATKHFSTLLTAFSFIAVLAACGGGGSDNSPTPPAPIADTTPDLFTFAAVTDASVNTEVSSAAINVSGINQSTTINITGGTYSIAGGAFTNATGTVASGQSVVVKVTSSTATNTAVESVLTIGGVAGNFKVTTKPDVTPDPFTFPAATGVVPKSVSTSSAITVAGIDVAVPISITGGEYSINDGAFTLTPGTVSKTQTVKVRGTASNNLTTNTNVELTIGGVKGNYSITTLADTVAPTAQILFPPPVSMTEGNTILVRGTASDDYSAVTKVKVNGIDVTPKAAGDFSTWQVSVPLTATTNNNIMVTTEDSVGNKSTNAAQVKITQGDHKNAFPSSSVILDGLFGMTIDQLNGRNRLLVADPYSNQIVSIDLATGERSVFASDVSVYGLTIEPTTQRLYTVETSKNKLMYFSLLDGVKTDVVSTELYEDILSLIVDDSNPTKKIVGLATHYGEIIASDVSSTNLSVISDGLNGIPNSDNVLIYPSSIVLDKKNIRYLVASGAQNKDLNKHIIYSVDIKTGARTIFSNNVVGSGDLFSGLTNDGNTNALRGLVIDEFNGQAIVGEFLKGRFYKVDLLTGNRTLFSSSPNFSDVNHIEYSNAIVLFGTNQYLFVSDDLYKGIYAVDIVTGERVIFSKSASNI